MEAKFNLKKKVFSLLDKMIFNTVFMLKLKQFYWKYEIGEHDFALR